MEVNESGLKGKIYYEYKHHQLLNIQEHLQNICFYLLLFNIIRSVKYTPNIFRK